MSRALLRAFRSFPTLLAATALVAAWASPAHGQATAPGRFVGTMTNDKITLRDLRDNTQLIRPAPRGVISSTHCSAETTFTAVDNGFDLQLTYRNNGATPATVGEIKIGTFRLGNTPWVYDFRVDAKRIPLDIRRTGAASGPDLTYPGVLYSPVSVFGNDRVAIGVQMMYPILEYQHNLIVNFKGAMVAGEPAWEAGFYIDSQVAPGQSRNYTIAVRIVDAGDAWIRTLVPYRDYFKQNYGEVRYNRDPRPVSGLTMADSRDQSGGNPWGISCPPAWRQDLNGWSRWAAFIRQRPTRNYSRVMLWKPTGLYPGSNANTVFPFRFMTRMNEFPAMRSSLNELRSMPSAALQVGYWWGSSTNIDRGWSPSAMEPLNIHNPDHIARANAELDMAVSLNASMIGLDAFGYRVPAWELHAWLRTMQTRAPHIRFITENALGDIFHVYAPTFVYGHDVQTPKVLADFLVPGHETWATVMFNMLATRLGRPLNDAEKHAEIARLCDLGYIPVVFDDFSLLGKNYTAAESWRTTIPGDLTEQNTGGGSGGTGNTGSTGGSGGGTGGGTGSAGGTGSSGGGGSATGGTGSTGGTGNGLGLNIPGVGHAAGPGEGSGSGGGGGGGGGGGVGGVMGGGGGGGGAMTAGGASGVSSGSGVAGVTGSAIPGATGGTGTVTTLVNPEGARFSSPLFRSSEIDAAIQRMRYSLFKKKPRREVPHEAPSSVTVTAPEPVAPGADQPPK